MKRWTETSKWDDPWFRGLSAEVKVFWLYLCDRCDDAGVWEEDWEDAEFRTKAKLSPEKMLQALASRIERVDARFIWLTKFIIFQNRKLSRDIKPQKRMWESIDKHRLAARLPVDLLPASDRPSEDDLPPPLTPLVPEREAGGNGKAEGKAKAKGKPKDADTLPDGCHEIRLYWNAWRNAPGRAWGNDDSAAPSGKGVKAVAKIIESGDYTKEQLLAAAERYLATKATLQEPQYLLKFKTFFGPDARFVEYIDAKHAPAPVAVPFHKMSLSHPEGTVYD